MGQNAQITRPQRGVISIDWMLLVVAAMVVLFCLGAFIRITTEPTIARREGGLMALAAQDSLLSFQDFSFSAQGWAPASTTDRLAGLGPVLGPFSDGAVTRSFQLPVEAVTVRVRFDLHLLGRWGAGDAVVVTLADEAVLSLGVSESGDAALTIPEGSGVAVDVAQMTIVPRPAEPALPGATEDAFVTFQVVLHMERPPETLPLRLGAELGDGLSWTLDNLAVVATTNGEG